MNDVEHGIAQTAAMEKAEHTLLALSDKVVKHAGKVGIAPLLFLPLGVWR
jgi:hypothetical protein